MSLAVHVPVPVLQSVLDRERRGDYLGKTVQVRSPASPQLGAAAVATAVCLNSQGSHPDAARA